jgi:hypothetical protein
MSLTYSQARDEMLALIKTAWDTTTFPMLWQDKPEEKPPTRTPWARTTLRHTGGGQASLVSFNGVSRFNREGIITVQVFTPSGEGLSRGYNLCKVISDVFEGAVTAGGVWFTNTTLTEVGQDGDWFQINVNTDFNYDELK